MKIITAVLQHLANVVANSLSETGGILGSRDGDIITDVVLDIPDKQPACHCQYAPNVRFLNEKIAAWAADGIRFMGLFHTHIGGSCTLSAADKRYITAIMQAMPPQVDRLYFPIYVMPERKMVSFVAVREGDEVNIDKENVIPIEL